MLLNGIRYNKGLEKGNEKVKYLICSYYKLNANGTGSLEIKVTDNINTPITNALVKIYKMSYEGVYNESAAGLVIVQLYTDNYGIINITLPPLNELTTPNEYYAASIYKDGFYNAYIYYIQIYPNIQSMYEVYLNPWIAGQPERIRLFFQPKRRAIHEH
ncbi:MAG TPA: hypothetical protein DCS12_00355 [Clostridiales bacterium]|nr:hypothetical protein [Clostridiales bacterium]